MNMPTPFAEPQPLLLRVEDFGALLDAGAFADYEKTELIEGVIVYMNAERSRNWMLRNELTFRFRDALLVLDMPYRAFSEPSISFPPKNVPRPDVAILRPARAGKDFTSGSLAMLIIEVADTTLSYDLGRKRLVYARAEVPEYWVVDVERATVERFWSPSRGDYRTYDTIPLEGELRLVTMPELAVDGRGIL